MAIKKEIDINVNTKGAEDSVDNLSSGLSGVAAQADKLTGGLVSGFRNGVKGIKNAVKGFKSLRVAIAATGIGALLIASGAFLALPVAVRYVIDFGFSAEDAATVDRYFYGFLAVALLHY